MKEENQSTAGICCPVFNSPGDRQENDSFEAIFEAMNGCNIVLPGDFVMAILLALPVKSLLRFKSVCWSWHDLILSRRFINIHHDRAKRSSLICFYNDKNVSRTVAYNSVSVSEDGTVTPLSLPPPTLYERHKIYVADSCRGMVCFSSGLCPKSVVVWNIATRKFRTFHGITDRAHPRNHITMRSNRMMSDLATGFTFLPITNEYKLVRVIIYFNNTVYIRITRWNINDSMTIFLPAKEIDMDFPYKITQFGRCLNANDAIHWLGHKIEGGPSIVIAFDMIEDKFREISTPFNHHDQNKGESCRLHHRKLALLNENRLAIFGTVYSDTLRYLSYTVWALNDYGGASESWAKQYTFETLYDLQPMGFWFNGEVVVLRMDGSAVKMGLYDWHTDQIKDLPVVINNEMYHSSIFYYKESLVPLPRTINNVCSNKDCPFQTSIKGSIISYFGCQTPSSDPDDDDDDEL